MEWHKFQGGWYESLEMYNPGDRNTHYGFIVPIEDHNVKDTLRMYGEPCEENLRNAELFLYNEYCLTKLKEAAYLLYTEFPTLHISQA